MLPKLVINNAYSAEFVSSPPFCRLYSKRKKKKNRFPPKGLDSKSGLDNKKKIKLDMDSSTPVSKLNQRRETVEIPSPPDLSPVVTESVSIASNEAPSLVSDPGQKSATGNSMGMDGAKITPTKRVETSANFEMGANNLFDAAMRSNALREQPELITNPEASIMEELANGVSLDTWSGQELNTGSEVFQLSNGSVAAKSDGPTNEASANERDKELNLDSSLALDGNIAGGRVGELNLNTSPALDRNIAGEKVGDIAGGMVRGLNLNTTPALGEDIAGGKVEDIAGSSLALNGNIAAGGSVGGLNLKFEAESIVGSSSGPKDSNNGACEERFKTPVKRRLIFGQDLTPEIRGSRATPGSSQVKRKNTGPQNTPESARRRRHTVSLDTNSELQGVHNSPKLNTPLQRLMMNRRGSVASLAASTPRRVNARKNGRNIAAEKDNKQRSIVDMLKTQTVAQEGIGLIEGVKQLAVDISNNKRETGLVSDTLNNSPKASSE